MPRSARIRPSCAADAPYAGSCPRLDPQKTQSLLIGYILMATSRPSKRFCRSDAMTSADSPVRLFTNTQVFDGTGRSPFAGEVLVKGNRIDAVGEAGARLDRHGAEVIDCGGATLMPGLVEAHAHLSW